MDMKKLLKIIIIVTFAMTTACHPEANRPKDLGDSGVNQLRPIADHLRRVKATSAGLAWQELFRSMEVALEHYSNVHRGTGQHSQISTELYEHARNEVLEYLDIDLPKPGEESSRVVIFGSERYLRTLSEHFSQEDSLAPQTLLLSRDIALPFGVGALIVERYRFPLDMHGGPYTGGGTAYKVLHNSVLWFNAPEKYEPGTPNIIGVIGFAKALGMIKKSGNPNLFKKRRRAKSIDNVLYNDPVFKMRGIELLDYLRKECLIGRDSQVPTISGPKRYINLDNAASTPTFSPIWESFKKALNLSDKAGKALIYEVKKVALRFFRAPASKYRTVFTQNTTEAINLVARELARVHIPYPTNLDYAPVLNTTAEHASNSLPYRQPTDKYSAAKVLQIGVDEHGFVDIKALEDELRRCNRRSQSPEKRIHLVAVSGASNVLGSVNKIRPIADICHKYGAKILVDAAQLAAHKPINIEDMDADFLVFSAHKMYAPFGSGGLIIRKGLLPRLKNQELSRMNVPGIAAIGKAMLILKAIGMDTIAAHEAELFEYLKAGLRTIDSSKLMPYVQIEPKTVGDFVGVATFNFDKMHDETLAEEIANRSAIGVRSGCFCAHILVRNILRNHAHPHLGMVRVSLGLYNTKEEIDILIDTLKRIASFHEINPHLDGAKNDLVAKVKAEVYEDALPVGAGKSSSSGHSTEAAANRLIFKHLADDLDIDNFGDHEVLMDADDWRGYSSAIDILLAKGYERVHSIIYHLSFCLQELESNSIKFSPTNAVLSAARLFKMKTEAGNDAYILEVAFSQQGGLSEKLWRILNNNLRGFALYGSAYLKSTDPDDVLRVKGVDYLHEGHGLLGVGMLMDSTSTSLRYAKLEEGMQTTIRLRLDTLFRKPPTTDTKKRDGSLNCKILQRIDLSA